MTLKVMFLVFSSTFASVTSSRSPPTNLTNYSVFGRRGSSSPTKAWKVRLVDRESQGSLPPCDKIRSKSCLLMSRYAKASVLSPLSAQYFFDTMVFSKYSLSPSTRP